MGLKHNKYNLTKNILYSTHGSKPIWVVNMMYKNKYLIKLKYQFLFACSNSHMKQDWKHFDFLCLLYEDGGFGLTSSCPFACLHGVIIA